MITLTPAYGHDYKSKADVVAAFDAGNDFILNDARSRWNEKPINKPQVEKTYAGQKIKLRFKKKRSLTLVQILTEQEQGERDK